MGPNKMNGSAQSLDSRIAAVLASEVVDKAALTSLLEEAHEALSMVQAVIEAETPRLHDLSNIDPDASLDLINRSKLRAARLELAIPKLRARIKAIEAYEHTQRWHAKADVLRGERDLLAEELAGTYEPFVVHLTDLYKRIDANTTAIDQLHGSAPTGENRRLLDVELIARGLDRYDAAHPRLRDQLRLPDFIRASVIAFPPNPLDEFNRRAAQMNAAMTRQLAAKHSLTTGPDWAAGRDLAIAQEDFASLKRDEELKAKEMADKATFERRLQDDDNRRRTGE